MKEYLKGRVIVKTGDITREEVDAIVNAANSSLMGGGGVDGAIHRAGGPAILAECQEIRNTIYPHGLPTGKAVITSAGNLPCQAVIHTTGPIWSRDGEESDRLLSEAYINSLAEAKKAGFHTIAFPAISTGVYGFPKERAAKVVSNALKKWIESDDSITIDLVFYNKKDYKIFIEEAEL